MKTIANALVDAIVDLAFDSQRSTGRCHELEGILREMDGLTRQELNMLKEVVKKKIQSERDFFQREEFIRAYGILLRELERMKVSMPVTCR